MILKPQQFIPGLIFALLLSGCVQRYAIRTVGGIIDNYGFTVLNEETDLDIAETSLAANLKLAEILLRGDPHNRDLLLLLTMGYSSYALGFAEDEDINRARLLCLRARDYGFRLLSRNKDFAAALNGDLRQFQNAMGKFRPSDVPAIFWTATAWGSYVKLSLVDPQAIIDLPRVEAMMDFVLEKDAAYYYGGAHLFMGTLYGSRPAILGGNLQRAKEHFESALRINDGKFLMSYVYYASSYAVQNQDQNFFEELLLKVETASPDILPEARLPNAIAKRKAKLLLSQIDKLF